MAHHVVHVAGVPGPCELGKLDGEVTDSPLTLKSGCITSCSLHTVLAQPQEGDLVDQLVLGPDVSFSKAAIKADLV
jgi:hypothetical protein